MADADWMSLLEEVSSAPEAAGIRHTRIGAAVLAAYGVNRESCRP